jgi:deoxyribodipyrimidine photo-lyase
MDLCSNGLKEVEKQLKDKDIPFFLLAGPPQEEIPKFVSEHNVGALVSDFDPLRIKRAWKDSIASEIVIPFFEVDAHNIVPCWIASPKQEYAAYTFRPKMDRAIPEFLEEFPTIPRHFVSWTENMENDWEGAIKSLNLSKDIPEVSWIRPGEDGAAHMLAQFISRKLPSYGQDRNDPLLEGQSNLSPYLHFGQISAQRVALEVLRSKQKAREFLDELIIRRELSDNFCFYNSHYDSFQGFPAWAKKSLDEHRRDEREHQFTLSQLERAQTYDELWNASQMETVRRGKMHGYMRMYWAKKILEWTESPEAALNAAIYLNDKYELDGRDPNGYAGIAWSVGGVHDRAWREREIFGKIRYMSRKGVESKYETKAYIQKVEIF